ncbi:ATP-dependent zinc protease [Rubritalea tangerina]|uniref:ATP-dependent zinc protease n=1 Tax=Rubritalea tangerina TaxID=430798 RepID=A0ABW4Z7G4_9BACT
MIRHRLLSTLFLSGFCIAPPSMAEEVETANEVITMGEVEAIGIVEARWHYPARIDTGATTSSIHAEKVEAFERDGEDWVRFELVNPQEKGKAKVLEKRVVRVAEIKRHGAESQKRYVVKLKARFAGREPVLEFSLADRSGYTYPLLVGRNLLRGAVVVDVSQKEVLKVKPFKKGGKK